jgi:Putative metallopeptidase
MRRRQVFIAAAVCAAMGCKRSDKKESPAAASQAATATATATTPVVASAPPAAASKAGHECGAQLARLDLQPLAARAPGAAAAPAPAKIDPRAISKDGIPTREVKSFAGVKQSGFRVVYSDSKNAIHEQFHQILQDNKMFDLAAQGLNETVRLPTTVDIQLVDCDQINAFYDPDSHRIIVCYDLLEYFVQVFKPAAKSDEELGIAVLGATLFSFYHETGHGLIHLLDLPAVGREEDSADQIATLILMAAGDDGVSMALSGAYWFQLQQKGGDDTPFWDEHGFDGQRFYNILCLIYGSDPAKYADFVTSGNLPQDRAAQCPAEYQKISHAWDQLLAPFLTSSGAHNAGVAPTVPADETAATAPPSSDHAITCEQVAEKAIELIRAEFEAQQAGKSDDDKADALQQLAANLPSFQEQFLAQCAKEDWPDKDRRCVLDASSIDAASKCGE